MTNLEYWAKRNAERQRRHEADAQAVLKKMNGIYADARSNIESDIFSIFGRFMSDNGLSVTDAQELLTGQDFKRWRKSLADYMKDIEAVGIDSLEGRALWLEVEVLSARSRINRLDALHALIGANMAQVAALQEKAVAEHLETLYFDDFYEGAFDFYQMGLKTAVDAAESGALALSNAFVHEVITEPWSGAMFSSRIWKNEWNMAQRVSEMVGRAMIAGHSHRRIARDISEALGVDKRNAERLILTESAHVKTEADLQLFRTLDIEQVEFNVTLDSRTCTTECAHHDGEIIDMNHLKDGVNKPPLHPRCRCTLLPHNEALESVRKREKRIARNAEGENIRVSGEMTYKEWLKIVMGVEGRVVDLENAQMYRPVFYGPLTRRRRRKKVITGAVLENTRNKIWLDSTVHITRKKQHQLDAMLDDIFKKLSVGNNAIRPDIMVVSGENMQILAKAAYHPVTNVLTIDEALLAAEDMKFTLTHELIHWEDAQNFKGKITKETLESYYAIIRRKHKKIIDKLGITCDNVINISQYAKERYVIGLYDEVYTEYRAKLMVEG